MRYFAAFESYVLVLYKRKTSSNKHAHVLVPSRNAVFLQRGREGVAWQDKTMLKRKRKCAWNKCSSGTMNRCVRLFQTNWKFFSLTLPLSPSLSCVKTGFLPLKNVSCFTNNSTGGKKLKQVHGGTLADSAKVGTTLRTKNFHNKFVLNTRFKLRSWYVKIHQILIKYRPILDQVLHSLWPGTTLVETKETFCDTVLSKPKLQRIR